MEAYQNNASVQWAKIQFKGNSTIPCTMKSLFFKPPKNDVRKWGKIVVFK